ncbi:MAG: hypothetical protein MZV63_11140 [Marinilabiliales bacterium]|nr:hypothetical protein [Marinilabiliales bacterium]
MKKLSLTALVLFPFILTFGQGTQPARPVDPNRMTPGMTEKWDPEVAVIQPGVTNSDAPSDAIVLFNGTDINNEWTDMQGKSIKMDC